MDPFGDPTLARGAGWFVLEALLTYGSSALITAAVIRRFCGPGAMRRLRPLLALGLGPAMIVLTLHMLLIVFPQRTSGFYVGTVLTMQSLIALAARRQFVPSAIEALAWLRWLAGWRDARRGRSWFKAIYAGVLALSLLVVGARAVQALVTLPTVGHDTWEYAALGKSIHHERIITFRYYPFFQHNGFYSVSRHAPSFPLFLTWERMLDDVLGVAPGIRHGEVCHKDSLFRSVSLYYGLLLLLGIAHVLAKESRMLAPAGVIAFVGTPASYAAIFAYYVDPFRWFFLNAMLLALHAAVARPSRGRQRILGATAGFAAYAHSIGAVAAGPAVCAFIAAAPLRWAQRCDAGLRVVAYATLCGGWHYLLDLCIGTHWILR